MAIKATLLRSSMQAPLPENEEQRISRLLNYNILDTQAETAYDDIAQLASHICQTPISLVSLVDTDRQWFKATVGLAASETPRDLAFCAHAILQTSIFVVPDAREDARFADNPLVTGAPKIRFYAGAPLITAEGLALGTLCVIDSQPRTLAPEQASALAALSRQVVNQLELRLSHQKLTQEIVERNRMEVTLRNTQAQMIQTEKMSGLGQLVAGVAHEINNPISFIHCNLNPASQYTYDVLTLLDLYQTQTPIPNRQIQAFMEEIDLEFIKLDLPKLLASMQTGTERIRELVLSLRNFSRLDEAEMKVVNLHEGIDNTLVVLGSRLKPKAGQPGINVVQQYGDLPKVACYAGQLNQVFLNVLSNAIDALEDVPPNGMSRPVIESLENGSTPQDGNAQPYAPTITIRTEVLPHNAIAIHIADNGHGIPERIRSKIFDPFFTTKTVGKGTGLGLAISYKIVVEKHDGRLQCHSQPGKGTELVIEIPVLPPETEFLTYHPAARKSVARTGHDRASTTCGTFGHHENLVSR
jgi:two-component system, NtrC family, sensor kinase